MPLIKLTHIHKTYLIDEGNTFQALNNINLTIDKGEFTAIIGPSGSGKSTLMNILGLLDKPSSGSYELEGLNVAHLKEDTLASLRNKKIGFVFQSFNLLPRTKAIDNVSLPLIYSGISKSERLQNAKNALESVGLADKLESTPNQLSGGQQQKVAIARALVTNPEVILADEPTGNLDSKSGSDIINIFKKLNNQSRTIILITHELNLAKNIKRIIRMKDGKIV